jgi:UDP-glucose 4-epimerase
MGAPVTVLDDFSTGREANIPRDTAVTVVEGTVTDSAEVRRLMAAADRVIHAAARNIQASTRNPRDDFEVNVGGTLNVLLAARELQTQRVLYTSSASVYGNPLHLPVNEVDAVNLLTPYAVSKFAGEGYCRAFQESYGISTTVLRYSNVYGPGQVPDSGYSGVIGKFIGSALARRPTQIHGDGEQTRDFTYVDDVVDATLLALTAPKADGEVYNVATGRETTINGLAELIARATGSAPRPEHIDKRDIDNIRRRVMNIEKIRRELRWVPTVTIETGVARTCAWMSERGNGEGEHDGA